MLTLTHFPLVCNVNGHNCIHSQFKLLLDTHYHYRQGWKHDTRGITYIFSLDAAHFLLQHYDVYWTSEHLCWNSHECLCTYCFGIFFPFIICKMQHWQDSRLRELLGDIKRDARGGGGGIGYLLLWERSQIFFLAVLLAFTKTCKDWDPWVEFIGKGALCKCWCGYMYKHWKKTKQLTNIRIKSKIIHFSQKPWGQVLFGTISAVEWRGKFILKLVTLFLLYPLRRFLHWAESGTTKWVGFGLRKDFSATDNVVAD